MLFLKDITFISFNNYYLLLILLTIYKVVFKNKYNKFINDLFNLLKNLNNDKILKEIKNYYDKASNYNKIKIKKNIEKINIKYNDNNLSFFNNLNELYNIFLWILHKNNSLDITINLFYSNLINYTKLPQNEIISYLHKYILNYINDYYYLLILYYEITIKKYKEEIIPDMIKFIIKNSNDYSYIKILFIIYFNKIKELNQYLQPPNDTPYNYEINADNSLNKFDKHIINKIIQYLNYENYIDKKDINILKKTIRCIANFLKAKNIDKYTSSSSSETNNLKFLTLNKINYIKFDTILLIANINTFTLNIKLFIKNIIENELIKKANLQKKPLFDLQLVEKKEDLQFLKEINDRNYDINAKLYAEKVLLLDDENLKLLLISLTNNSYYNVIYHINMKLTDNLLELSENTLSKPHVSQIRKIHKFDIKTIGYNPYNYMLLCLSILFELLDLDKLTFVEYINNQDREIIKTKIKELYNSLNSKQKEDFHLSINNIYLIISNRIIFKDNSDLITVNISKNFAINTYCYILSNHPYFINKDDDLIIELYTNLKDNINTFNSVDIINMYDIPNIDNNIMINVIIELYINQFINKYIPEYVYYLYNINNLSKYNYIIYLTLINSNNSIIFDTIFNILFKDIRLYKETIFNTTQDTKYLSKYYIYTRYLTFLNLNHIRLNTNNIHLIFYYIIYHLYEYIKFSSKIMLSSTYIDKINLIVDSIIYLFKYSLDNPLSNTKIEYLSENCNTLPYVLFDLLVFPLNKSQVNLPNTIERRNYFARITPQQIENATFLNQDINDLYVTNILLLYNKKIITIKDMIKMIKIYNDEDIDSNPIPRTIRTSDTIDSLRPNRTSDNIDILRPNRTSNGNRGIRTTRTSEGNAGLRTTRTTRTSEGNAALRTSRSSDSNSS